MEYNIWNKIWDNFHISILFRILRMALRMTCDGQRFALPHACQSFANALWRIGHRETRFEELRGSRYSVKPFARPFAKPFATPFAKLWQHVSNAKLWPFAKPFLKHAKYEQI